jgi:predicted esterase
VVVVVAPGHAPATYLQGIATGTARQITSEGKTISGRASNYARCASNPVYTDGVYKTLVPCIWMLALATSSLVAQNPSAQPTPPALPPGVVIPQQTCAAKPDDSYALYLPSHYAPDKRWPIIYAFDPDGRGNVPVELMKDAAERYGYIVAGSNNSRNGSWKVETESAQAMFDDTHARLAIDDHRIYLAGFSGGARVASALAQGCKCAAGVLLNGAGFAGTPPSHDAVFAVFAAVGSYDFNYPELSALDEKLEQAGFPHALLHFDGPHEWAPPEVMDEALAWFRLIAMKQNREARDDNFVALQKTQDVARAQALEKSGQSYEALHDYRQAIATFDGLADTASLQQAAAALAQQKAVREGAKHEAQEFQEQNQLTSPIYSGLVALRGGAVSGSDIPNQTEQSIGSQQRPASHASGSNAVSRSDIFHQTEQQIIDLRERAASEKHPDKLRVDRRALTGVFIAAGEFGDDSLAARDYALAKDYFQLASDAYPDSVGALKELAQARALDNDRKGALEALRRAKEKSKDLAAFSAWLNHEPAFAQLRDDPQFHALLANP